MSFKKVKQRAKFPKLEEEVLKFWHKNKIFAKSIKNREGKKDYIFYEGPPTANGKPGIHHVLARAFKDIYCRYKTMKGYRVLRRAGWDTQGLPVEIEVEKSLGLSGKKDIEDLVKGDTRASIIKFNEGCRKSVWKYKSDWEDLTRRMGFWIDMSDPYITYENEYLEKLWGLIKKIWDKGLLFKDYKVMLHCPRCETSLSSHEVAQGYKKVKEDSVFIKFKIKEKDEYILVWTTTPWTLPGNVALAVGKDIDYVLVESEDKEKLILAESRSDVVRKAKVIKKFKGKDLLGLEYEPLFKAIPKKELTPNTYKVVEADFVDTTEGTGVVHTAVMYGEEDYQLGEEVGLPKYHTVSTNGTFVDEVKEFKGQFVKDAEEGIIENLKKRGLLYKVESYEHSYPFCWRCESPLLYYARDSWYIGMSKLRDKLKKNNQKINWVPAHQKEGRFGEWLNEVKDWAISRERYWGTPLPVWQCQKCENVVCIGSKDELEKKAKKGDKTKIKKLDLHRPFVDEINLKCEKCRGEMERDLSVIDAWFDSGAMPYASDEKEKGRFPADFISEAIDQTRGWFYTLLAISTLMDDRVSYKNVVSLGHIVDKHGKKMSKSRGNIVDPTDIAKRFGMDILRLHFFSMNKPGERKKFDEEDLLDLSRRSLSILHNSYYFFSTYANIDGWKPKASDGEKIETKSKNILDKWIIERLKELNSIVTTSLNKYDACTSSREIIDFIDDLSNWYIRRSRRRFWKEEDDQDKKAAYETLYSVLLNTSKILAPFCPFISEELYQNLKTSLMEESVHLGEFPSKSEYDKKLLEEMKKARIAVTEGLKRRAGAGVKVRQPLAWLEVTSDFGDELKKIIAEEVNVKEVKKGKQLDLDTKITEELKDEGIAREITRIIQEMRRKADFNIEDRINIFYTTDSKELKKILGSKWSKYIKKETLAKELKEEEEEKGDYKEEVNVNGEKITFILKRI